MLQSFSDWLTSPLRGPVPLWTLLVILGVWLVLAWIVWDTLCIAKEFTGEAVEAIA